MLRTSPLPFNLKRTLSHISDKEYHFSITTILLIDFESELLKYFSGRRLLKQVSQSQFVEHPKQRDCIWPGNRAYAQNREGYHCAKIVHIWCLSGPHFLTFGLNTEIFRANVYSVRMRENADQNNSEHFSCSIRTSAYVLPFEFVNMNTMIT